MSDVIEVEHGELVAEGQHLGLHIYQFVGLVSLLRFDSGIAAKVGEPIQQQWGAMNSILACYAALEALITETALILRPDLYQQKNWRHAGLVAKFEEYLRDAGRGKEALPDLVSEVSNHRIALTHSEPDNPRIAALNDSILRLDAVTYVKRVQEVAHFLWQGDGPRHFEGAF